MLSVAVAILAFDFVVTLAFYASVRAPFLPRMPTNIASTAAFFAASRAVRDFSDDPAVVGGPREGDEGQRQGERRRENSETSGSGQHGYAYGRFIGTDGRAHVGVERVPFVQPLRKRKGWLGNEQAPRRSAAGG